jgi:hypothetical protein
VSLHPRLQCVDVDPHLVEVRRQWAGFLLLVHAAAVGLRLAAGEGSRDRSLLGREAVSGAAILGMQAGCDKRAETAFSAAAMHTFCVLCSVINFCISASRHCSFVIFDSASVVATSRCRCASCAVRFSCSVPISRSISALTLVVLRCSSWRWAASCVCALLILSDKSADFSI